MSLALFPRHGGCVAALFDNLTSASRLLRFYDLYSKYDNFHVKSGLFVPLSPMDTYGYV